MSARHAGLAAVVLFAAAASGRADGTADVGAIRAALRDFQETIHSLHVEYTLRRLPGGVNPGGEYPAEQWEWAQQGRRRLLASEPITLPGMDFPVRTWASFDGSRGYWLLFHRSDASRVNQVRIFRQPPDVLRRDTHIPLFLGWELLNTEENVLTLLTERRDAPASREVLNGVPCVKVEVGAFTPAGASEHLVVAWFDPAQDWLPRRISVTPTAFYRAVAAGEPPPALAPGSQVAAYDVESFVSVEDPLLDRSRSFPSRMRSHSAANYELVVDSVSVNSLLPEEMFRPEAPIGAEVVEEFGTARMTSTVAGGAEGLALRERALAEDHELLGIAAPQQEGAEFTGGIDATPRRGWISASTVVLIVSAVVLVLAVVARLKGW